MLTLGPTDMTSVFASILEKLHVLRCCENDPCAHRNVLFLKAYGYGQTPVVVGSGVR